jgi:site-specific recombinase XerD
LSDNGFGDPNVQEITSQILRRYLFYVVGKGVRPRTVRSSVNALRCLFAYLHGLGAIATNPAQEVRLPKLDSPKRLLVGDDDLEKLLQAVVE